MFIPIVAQQLSRVLRAIRTITTLEITHRAILVTAPTNTFGMLGMQWKFLGHG